MDYTLEKNDTGKNIGDDFKLGKIAAIILAWNKSNKVKKSSGLELEILKQEEGDLDNAKDILKKYNTISECHYCKKLY